MTRSVLAAMAALLIVSTRAQAARERESYGSGAGVGFDIIGNYYQPTDSRYQGVGTGVGLNIRFDDSLTMGYRVEELNVRAEDTVGGNQVVDNFSVIIQGITAYYRTLQGERSAVDFGLWTGAATTSDFNAAGTTGMTSPMIEPMGRLVYSVYNKVETHVMFGLGYRFIPRFTLANPFGGSSSRLNNFSGLDINFGVGVSF